MASEIINVLRTGTSKEKVLALIDHARSFCKTPSLAPGDLSREGKWTEAISLAAVLPEEDSTAWRILLACKAKATGQEDRASEIVQNLTAPPSGTVLCYPHATAVAALLPQVLPARPEDTFRMASWFFWASQTSSNYHGGVRSRELQSPLNSFFARLCKARRFDEAEALLSISTSAHTSHLLERLLYALMEDGRAEKAKSLIPREEGWIRERAIVSCVEYISRAKGEEAGRTFALEIGGIEILEKRAALGARMASASKASKPESVPALSLSQQLDELVGVRGLPFIPKQSSDEWFNHVVSLGKDEIVTAARTGCRFPAVAVSSLAAYIRKKNPKFSTELAQFAFEFAFESKSDAVIEDVLDDCLDVARESNREDLAEQWIEKWLSWRFTKNRDSESSLLLSSMAEMLSIKGRIDLIGPILRRCSSDEECAEVAGYAAGSLTGPGETERLARALQESPFPVAGLASATMSLPEKLRQTSGILAEALEARFNSVKPDCGDVIPALVRGGRMQTAIRVFETLPPGERSDLRLAAALEAYVRNGNLERAVEIVCTGHPAALHEGLELLATELAATSDAQIETLTKTASAKPILVTMLCSAIARQGRFDRILRWLPEAVGAKRPHVLELAREAFAAGHQDTGDRLLVEAEKVDERGQGPGALEDSDIARRMSALCAAGRHEAALALLEEKPSGYAAWQGVEALLKSGQPTLVPRAVSIFLDQTREKADPTYTGYQYTALMDRMAQASYAIPEDVASIGLSLAFRVPDLGTQTQYLSQCAWALIKLGRWKDALPILDHMPDSERKGRIAARIAWEMVQAGREDGLNGTRLLEIARRSPSSLMYLYKLALEKGHIGLAESLLPTLLGSEEAANAVLSVVLEQLDHEDLQEVIAKAFGK